MATPGAASSQLMPSEGIPPSPSLKIKGNNEQDSRATTRAEEDVRVMVEEEEEEEDRDDLRPRLGGRA